MSEFWRNDERKDGWATPQDLFDKLNAEFGFTVDLAASDENHKCERYYTKEQDGLSQDWSGEVAFCNPPYGRQMWKWVKKAHETPGATIVMLLPSHTGTYWFHEYALKHEVRFIRGRLKYGGGKTDATFDSLVLVIRNGDDRNE